MIMKSLKLFLPSKSHYIIIRGDFNIKYVNWGCRSNNSRKLMFFNVIQNHKLSVNRYFKRTNLMVIISSIEIFDFFISSIPSQIHKKIDN